MRVLVTGNAGFIGAHLAARLLGDGCEVWGVDNLSSYYSVQLKRDRMAALLNHERFHHREVDITDADELADVFREARPERVFHLAGQAGVRHSLEAPREYVDANIVGSFNTVELCREHAVSHLVMASTSSAYGARPGEVFRETDPATFPLTAYAATKRAAELLAHSTSHLHGLPVTVLRFFTVYGPWGRPDMAPHRFARRLLAGEPLPIYGEGDMARDFTFVDDLVASMAALGDVPPVLGEPVDGDSLSPVAPFRTVNIGGSRPTPLMDFVRTLADALGVEAELDLLPMQPGDVRTTHASSSLLRELTGSVPVTPLETGVRQFASWYRGYYS